MRRLISSFAFVLLFLAFPVSALANNYTISGNIYVDLNKNGVKDIGESNYSGITVTLSENTSSPGSTSQRTTATDSNGNYSFTDTPEGDYYISISMPPGYTGTTPAIIFGLGGFHADRTQDFGIVQAPVAPIAFSDTFTDANGTALSTHDSNWDILYGSPTIQDNKLHPNNSGFTLPNFVLGDYCASFDFEYPINVYLSMSIRNQAGSAGGYGASISDPDHTNQNYNFALWHDANEYFEVKGFPVSAIPAGTHNLKLCAIGSQISLRFDNTPVITATDTTYSQGYSYYDVLDNDIDNFKLEAFNQPPSVGAISLTTNPAPVNNSTTATGTFTDADTSDTHTAVWDWGDGTTSSGTVTESNGSGSVSNSHTYTASGVYEIALTVTDNAGAQGTKLFQYLTVYDASAGWASGAKEFTSPVGAVTGNSGATGKADFGFQVKYQQGDIVPSGKNVELSFPAGNIDFVSTGYLWLAVNGTKVTLKATGTLNGVPGYTILVSAIDQGTGNPSGLVRFQIKDSNGNVVYDTQSGAGDTADPTAPVTKGKIAVH